MEIDIDKLAEAIHVSVLEQTGKMIWGPSEDPPPIIAYWDHDEQYREAYRAVARRALEVINGND